MQHLMHRYVMTAFAVMAAIFWTQSALAQGGGYQLHLGATEGLVDDSLKLAVTGLPPGERVILRASLVDAAGVTWSGEGQYFADIHGTVDPAVRASVAGTYVGVDGNGLLWSMLPVPPEGVAAYRESQRHDATKRSAPFLPNLMPVDITLEAGVAGESRDRMRSVHYTQRQVDQGVRSETVRAGRLRGVLFEPRNSVGAPAVIVLTGSGGGINNAKAALLASRGFTALALAYFRYDDLPSEAVNVPLEYFRDAIAWLGKRVGHDRIALIGASRGGEGVLLIASTFPEVVKAVVAEVPSHLVYGGVTAKGMFDKPLWTYQGKPLPFVPLQRGQDPSPLSRGDRISQREQFITVWNNAEMEERYGIPVEKIKAPILLIAGEADEMWPSELGAQRVVLRLQRHGFALPVKYMSYPNAGHVFNRPGAVTSLAHYSRHAMLNVMVPLGGTPQGNAESAAASWTQELAFLRNSLSRP